MKNLFNFCIGKSNYLASVRVKGSLYFSDTLTRRVNCKSILMGNRGSYVKNFINIYILDPIIQLLRYLLEKNLAL